MFAQLDHALIVKRLREGRRAKKAAGGHGEGRYSFGWGPSGEVAREQKILGHARRMWRHGASWQMIRDDLNTRGPAYAPRFVATWSLTNTRTILDPDRPKPSVRAIASLQTGSRQRPPWPATPSGRIGTGEAARILGIAPTTVRRWTDDGLIACTLTADGQHRRMLTRDVARLAEEIRSLGLTPREYARLRRAKIQALPQISER